MLPIYKTQSFPAGIKARNFFLLLQRISAVPTGPLGRIYAENLELLKENIKILNSCPSLLQIRGIFLDIYVTSKYCFDKKT